MALRAMPLARLTNHGELGTDARRASRLARNDIRPTYYNARRGEWASGHLRSGAPVVSLTGSSTALLHHGLLGEAEKGALLDELASPPYRARWGIRSTPSDSPLYEPDSYARGSVWALGTADAIMAFYEAGRPTTATALWRDLIPWFALDAPGHMHEALAGNAFVAERESVPDQTWSAAAFVSSAVRGMLGLQLDGAKREVRFSPQLPPEWDSLRVRRINLRGADISLALRTSPDAVELAIETAGPTMTLTFRPALSAEARVRAAEVSDGSRLLVGAQQGSPYEVSIVCAAARTTHVMLHLNRPPR